MSGDTQPRKRKDKKRKKDDGIEQVPPQLSSPPTPSSNSNVNEQDINIHVHKEGGTGGGICAKVVFFLLFSALAVLIGLIITEHRGLTDLDAVDSESRFAQIFEGWTDASPPVGHDDDDQHIISSLEEHEEEANDSQGIDERDEDHYDKSIDEKTEEESNENDQTLESEDNDNNDEDEDEVDDDDNDTVSQENSEDVEESQDAELEDEDNFNDDEEENSKDYDDDEEEYNKSNVQEDEEESNERTQYKEQEGEIDQEEDDDDNDDNDNDDDVIDKARGEEELEENVSVIDEQSPKTEGEDGADDHTNSRMVIKIGVGVALLVVAYVVLIRKWKSDTPPPPPSKENEEHFPDLSRRNTLIVPPQYQEIEQDIEDIGDDEEVNVGDDNELEDSDSESDAPYNYENITNKYDWQVKDKIDEAQKNIPNNAAYALTLFDALLQHYPYSPRIQYGKAQCLDTIADQKRSNELLIKAIDLYLHILDLQDITDTLFEIVADRCINRSRFIGYYNRAIEVHKKLISRFPHIVKYRNQLAVTYLTTNRVNEARHVLHTTLKDYPDDGFALVHYGFLLKTADNNLNESIEYMQKGIETKVEGVIDGRFYFHLGDALARVGKPDEAMKVYEEGVQHKVFLSKYQRSLYNVDRLKAQPWWTKEETPYKQLYSALENNWKQIRDEGFSVLSKNGMFQSETEMLKDTGDWKQFELYSRGRKNVENCKSCPGTCKIIDSIPDAKGCRRGQTKFSVMHPGTHVWPHCGPTNCRLRIHLGLKVPEHTYIRVADEIRTWNNGEVLIFDDSFEHEVWHNGTTYRLILIVDLWHPELTLEEKRSLSSI